MKKTSLVVPLIVFAALVAWNQMDSKDAIDDGAAEIVQAFHDRASDLQVTGSGIVKKLLPDDNDGSRHQRFVLLLPPGHTLLVAHNIDLAPKITTLEVGDTVVFNGEYEWNPRGGVLHWTHHDPQRRHEPGWLRHNGKTYQ